MCKTVGIWQETQQVDVWDANTFCDADGFAFQFDLGTSTPALGGDSCVIQREMSGEAHWSDLYLGPRWQMQRIDC